MARVSLVTAFGIFVLAGSLAVSAQAPQGRGRGAQQPPQNLQVLPQDANVIQVMQAFTAALGVTCDHCHVFNGFGDPMTDFASDAKPQKNMARAMMRMVGELNGTVATAVSKPADQATRVTCAMCHRGSTTPEVAAGSPGAPPPPRGGGAGRGRGN